MNKKRFVSLNIKLTIVVVIALVAAFCVYIVFTWLTEIMTEKYYTNEASNRASVEEAYKDLERYIKDHNVEGTNVKAIVAWLEGNSYTTIHVRDNLRVYADATWTGDSKKSVVATNLEEAFDDDAENTEKIERITYDDANIDDKNKNRIIRFADDDYYVFIDVFKEEQFKNIMAFIKLVLCVSTLIGIVLFYNGRLMRRMIRLSQEVHIVSEGDLAGEIEPTANDEIGRLAVSVDNMRDSIVERLRNEKAAWDANTQLITAMSHDIRTPLTSLIGYLDIIESEKYSSKEEELKYISSCREKAFQLKDLSDKLFQYFLVFGSHEKEKSFEVFDAGILLQQLISEHSAELIGYGFKIDFDYGIENAEIEADISGLRRLFDNVFSNIMKYGDKSYHVSISAIVEDNYIIIRLINSILTVSRKVESNKIGLKTCEKICSDVGGSFSYKDEGLLFTARIKLPVYQNKKTNDSIRPA